MMQYSLNLAGFEGQQFVLETRGLWRRARLLQNGLPVPPGPRRGTFELLGNDGRVVLARFKPRGFGFDPVPGVEVGGTVVAPVAALTWYQWLWLGLPLLLILEGGGLGALVGALAVGLSVRVFRSNRRMAARYGLTAAISAAALLIFVTVVGFLRAVLR
jgi:hypothetical protein